MGFVAAYFLIGFVLGLYVYFDTLKDYKFRAAAKEFGLWVFFGWLPILIFGIYAHIYSKYFRY